MRRAVLALLLPTSAIGCAPGRAIGGANAESPIVATAPAEDTSPVTVLFLDAAGRAVPLSCASPGVGLYPDPADCLELIEGDPKIADLGGGRRTLGASSPWICGGNDRRVEAFRIDPAPGRRYPAGDPANELLVWPSTRAAAVAVWTAAPPDTTVPPEVGHSYQEVAATLVRFTGMSYDARDARLTGSLLADIDGDGTPDQLFSIGTELRPSAGPAAPRMVLGALSSRPDELAVLLSHEFDELAAFAAVDLDGDGAAEVVVAAPNYQGDATAVYRFDASDATLVAIGGIACGD